MTWQKNSKLIIATLTLMTVLAPGFSSARNKSNSDQSRVKMSDAGERARKFYLKFLSRPTERNFLGKTEFNPLYQKVAKHPIASLNIVDQYDTPEGAIGYCFGRAEAARLEARKMGLKDEAIRKLFIVGDLRSRGVPEWRFHVTTLVRGEDRRWYAIDPIMGQVLTMQRWIYNVRMTWDNWQDKVPNHPTGQRFAAKLYLTDSDIIIPDLKNSHPDFSNPEKDIIDLDFDPDQNQSFKLNRQSSESDDPLFQFYNVSRRAQESFFRNVANTQGKEFNLEEIVIKGFGKLSYKNYFFHLISHTITGKIPKSAPARTQIKTLSPTRAMSYNPIKHNHLGVRIGVSGFHPEKLAEKKTRQQKGNRNEPTAKKKR